MPKRSKKQKKYLKRKTRKIIKKLRKCKRGGDYDKVTCCMCGREVNINDTLVPSKCLQIHGKKAHRICSECWWNPTTGFARENAPHGCPGCAKNLPLTKVQNTEPVMVDLTLDDD